MGPSFGEESHLYGEEVERKSNEYGEMGVIPFFCTEIPAKNIQVGIL